MAAFALSFAGACTVTKIPPDFIRGLLPCVLLAVAIYTFKKKDFASVHAPVHSGMTERVLAVGMGGCLGCDDGFFGPGTGSLLIFPFVRFFGFDLLSASAAANVANVACSLSALMWFGYSGHLLWQLGLLMAICQVAGSLVGTRLAIRHGSGFVRKLFLVVVSVLILKSGFDAVARWHIWADLFHVKQSSGRFRRLFHVERRCSSCVKSRRNRVVQAKRLYNLASHSLASRSQYAISY